MYEYASFKLSSQAVFYILATKSKIQQQCGQELCFEGRQLKKDYFFGYFLSNGTYVAEPEKALIDQLYMISRDRAAKDTSEWSLINLEKNKLLEYSRKFPESVRKSIDELMLRFGKHIVTSDRKLAI